MPPGLLEPSPVTPGEILRDEFLPLLKVTQDEFAEALGVSRVTVNQLLNDRRAVTAEMALRLSHVLGTTAQFWMNLQNEVDLYRARRRRSAEIGELRALRPAAPDGVPDLVALDALLAPGRDQDDDAGDRRAPRRAAPKS